MVQLKQKIALNLCYYKDYFKTLFTLVVYVPIISLTHKLAWIAVVSDVRFKGWYIVPLASLVIKLNKPAVLLFLEYKLLLIH